MASHALLAYATCLLGQWNRSTEHLQAALALARELDHPFSLSYALQHAMLVAHARRTGRETLGQAEELLRLAEERDYAYWLGPGMIGKGWALAEERQSSRGLASIREGLAAHHAGGAGLSSTLWEGMLAEALVRAGQPDEALDHLENALDRAIETGERIWEAELLRLKGELLIDREADIGAAETSLRQALETARRQQAKVLELRAAMSLSRLRHRKGAAGRARNELQAVYAGFSEGFDAPDMVEARKLLDAWA